jgi:uncharacterized lipoprotein YddW (UPF0748 family)
VKPAVARFPAPPFRFAGPGLLPLLLLAALLPFPLPSRGAEQLRGLWVDTFHPAMRDEAEVRQLVADARSGGFNALFVEVRKRGDAYYESRFEPKAADVAPGFDPLRRLLELAHDPTAGRRLDIHAWIVAFNIWNQRDTPPTQPDHPYRKHPDWLTRSAAGATWDGANYAFDPGHPGVQQHTFEVALDLVRRYDLDGLHWDYVRYAGKDWGYNDVAVGRFNARHGRTGKPASTDPDWLQFRRDQVTALVRKVYLAARAEKPALKISAATITFAPGISDTAQWPNSAAYSDVLQDWRAWMEEGILDWNLPMTYFRQTERPEDYANWNLFLKDHQYRRRAAPGIAFYLNSLSDSLAQVRLAHRPSVRGHAAAGLLVYSYAALGTDVSRAEALAALTQPTPASPEPPFAEPASPPPVPWKTAPTSGHLRGLVLRSADDSGVDAAEVLLGGTAERTLSTDATGFFGAVDLPPGNYQIRVRAGGFGPLTADVSIVGGQVADLEFALTPPEPPLLEGEATDAAIVADEELMPRQSRVHVPARAFVGHPQPGNQGRRTGGDVDQEEFAVLGGGEDAGIRGQKAGMIPERGILELPNLFQPGGRIEALDPVIPAHDQPPGQHR